MTVVASLARALLLESCRALRRRRLRADIGEMDAARTRLVLQISMTRSDAAAAGRPRAAATLSMMADKMVQHLRDLSERRDRAAGDLAHGETRA